MIRLAKYIASIFMGCLVLSFISTINNATFAADNYRANSLCPSYHTQYDQLINGPADQVITARHRGNFDTKIPENSLGAFIKSFQQCQPQVETDVRTTKDGKLILFHDVSIGKMLEPKYNPDSNTGPNERINNISFADLRKKKLLTIDRETTQYEVPTVEELLQTMLNNNASSIVSLEVKEEPAIIPTAKAVYDFTQEHPGSNFDKRIIIKFGLQSYPTIDKWRTALAKAGIKSTIMADPVLTPQAAAKIDEMPALPEVPGIKLTSNVAKAVASWATAPIKEVPIFSLLLKDASDFHTTKTITDEYFGKTTVPSNLSIENTTEGTVAHALALLQKYHKKLEIFVPIPDYIMWRPGPVAGYTVQNTFGDKVPIDVREAYFNNTSSCCYALKDRKSTTKYAKELRDDRGNLAFIFSLRPTLITADDTDSIEVYAAAKGKLNQIARPKYHRAEKAMESALQYTVDKTSPPRTSIVNLKGWNGGRSDAWQGQVCLWSDKDSYAWVVKCGVTPSKGYTDLLEISVVAPGKMRIRDTLNWHCLRWEKGETEVISWSANCTGEQAEWTLTADNRFITPAGNAITFGWQDRYYWGIPFAYAQLSPDHSVWAKWKFR